MVYFESNGIILRDIHLLKVLGRLFILDWRFFIFDGRWHIILGIYLVLYHFEVIVVQDDRRRLLLGHYIIRLAR